MAAAYGQSSPHDLPTPGQVLAQDTLPDDAVVPPPISAPVILDGRPIFSVANTQQVTSVERATYVSKELADLVQRQTVFRVNWVRRDDVPVILVNGGYLMTVTQADADLAEVNSAVDLARDWTDLIRVELRQAQTERSQSVLMRRSGIALGVLLLAIALHRAMGFLWQRSLRPALEHMAVLDGSEADPPGTPTGLNLLLNLLLLLARGGLWFGASVYITNLFPITRSGSYFLRQQAWKSLVEPNLRLGQSTFSVLNLLILIGLLLGLVVLAGVFTNFLRSRVLHLAGIDRGSREAVAILTKYGVIFIGTVVLLQIWGLDLSSLALIASALGVGIGLGLQNITKDFGSGIVLVFERPIQVGDFVEFGEFQGTVERIGARSTEIKTLDQISIIVPNSRFLEQEVINWSHRNPVSRIRIPVGVAYSSDPAQVREVLLAVSHHHSKVLSMPAPQVFFVGFGDSALNFDLLVWIAEPHRQLVIKSDLYFSIEAKLRDRDIEIPFPQRDLHIRSGQLPINMTPNQGPG
jgi:potassium efflux system protein